MCIHTVGDDPGVGVGGGTCPRHFECVWGWEWYIDPPENASNKIYISQQKPDGSTCPSNCTSHLKPLFLFKKNGHHVYNWYRQIHVNFSDHSTGWQNAPYKLAILFCLLVLAFVPTTFERNHRS